MSEQKINLYRPFEDKISRVASVNGAIDRLRQNLWGEPNQKEVAVKVIHSVYDEPSNRVYCMASQDEVHLEVHSNPELYQRLYEVVAQSSLSRKFTRYSVARFIIDNGFELNY